MRKNIITSIALLFLTLAAVFFGKNLAQSFAVTEKLYPVEEVKIARPASEIFKTMLAANPFIPVRNLPAVPKVSLLSSDVLAAQKLTQRAINLKVVAEGNATTATQHCEALVEKTLTALPTNLTSKIKDLSLYLTERKSRGMSNSHLIELRCADMSDEELVSVLIHEIGHTVDLGYLRGSGNIVSDFTDGSLLIPTDDMSVEFYQLSWKNSEKQHFTASRKDFVSGYAMSDPFEDFAESFNFYLLHGSDFRILAKESKTLQAKYDFLQENVFAGKEFSSTVTAESGKRVWDTTLLPIALQAFLGES